MCDINELIERLRYLTKDFQPPMVDSVIKKYGKNPFLILISCLLSLRSKDIITWPICQSLFSRAQNPEAILAISLPKLEKMLFKLGFYKKKASLLHEVSRILINDFEGKVPFDPEKLRNLPGVGPKTVNLVLGYAFDIPAICVDIHVHRISNRLGIISTTTPEESQEALEKLIPRQYWIEYNNLLVVWGQNICVPVSPWCSQCGIFDLCERKNVKNSR
jgi:endonuclease III